jgi:hypothetical protein
METVGKLFEKILLARIQTEVRKRGLMRDEFGFRPKFSLPLSLARLTERITSNSGENRLTGSFPRRRQNHCISEVGRFEVSFQTATPSYRGMRVGAVVYPEFFWEGVQQIQLRTEGRENGDLGAVAP